MIMCTHTSLRPVVQNPKPKCLKFDVAAAYMQIPKL